MQKPRRYALILAGGRGTRFWPRSRARAPKQLLRFFGPRSLLEETYERLRPMIPAERFWILTNDHLRSEIARQLPEVPRRQILAEPVQRNTAPCIGLAARIIQDIDPGAVLGIFPADHHISRPVRFRRLLRPAFHAAAQGKLVVLGIQPRWPETGYGYLEFPAGAVPGSETVWPVQRFREKPDLPTAREFLAAGRFFWNAGMFFWRTDVFLEALRRHLPRVSSLLMSLPPLKDRRFRARLAETYPRCENISIDYGVMEKADGVAGVAADDIGWNDLGSWNAVFDLLAKDPQNNATRGPLLAHSSAGNYVEAPGKLVALVGVQNLVVVDTPDALLIADRARAQQVGEVVRALEKRKRTELL